MHVPLCLLETVIEINLVVTPKTGIGQSIIW